MIMKQPFGPFLKEIREKHSLSQAQMADILGFNNSQSIAILEGGRKMLPLQKYESFCKFFHINLKEFTFEMYQQTLVFKAKED